MNPKDIIKCQYPKDRVCHSSSVTLNCSLSAVY